MARIRHIALLTKDTEKLAAFYKASFGLNEVARSGEANENGRAIYLSDGHINLAILPARNRREGIYHFGMEVEDIQGAAETAKSNGATGALPTCLATAVLPRPLSSIRWVRGSIYRAAGRFSFETKRLLKIFSESPTGSEAALSLSRDERWICIYDLPMSVSASRGGVFDGSPGAYSAPARSELENQRQLNLWRAPRSVPDPDDLDDFFFGFNSVYDPAWPANDFAEVWVLNSDDLAESWKLREPFYNLEQAADKFSSSGGIIICDISGEIFEIEPSGGRPN